MTAPEPFIMKLQELAKFLSDNGFENQIDGIADLDITAVNTLKHATKGEITFLANPKYRSLLATTNASAVIVRPDDPTTDGLTTIRTADPYGAITAAIIRIHGHRQHPQWGIDVSTRIADSASISQNANIGPHVTIGENATIGRNATIYPGCFIGANVSIGDDVMLFPNVVVYDGVQIGNRVSIHAGSSIGQDGLGYAPIKGEWLKIPQVGSVIIEDDVEIGALCAIDRATLGTTRIGKGTKFSNLVVVGHGTDIGEHCMFVAQVGIAGSVKVGRHVTLAGQVGVSGHLSIGDDARVGAQAGVAGNLEGGAEYLGSPAIESMKFKRQIGHVSRLPKMKSKLDALQREIDALRESMNGHADDESS